MGNLAHQHQIHAPGAHWKGTARAQHRRESSSVGEPCGHRVPVEPHHGQVDPPAFRPRSQGARQIAQPGSHIEQGEPMGIAGSPAQSPAQAVARRGESAEPAVGARNAVQRAANLGGVGGQIIQQLGARKRARRDHQLPPRVR